MNIDQLIYERERARLNKDFEESDRIRDLLDFFGVFVFDGVEGQEVYHRKGKTRDEVKKEILRDSQAERNFEAYLTSVRNSKSYKELYKI